MFNLFKFSYFYQLIVFFSKLFFNTINKYFTNRNFQSSNSRSANIVSFYMSVDSFYIYQDPLYLLFYYFLFYSHSNIKLTYYHKSHYLFWIFIKFLKLFSFLSLFFLKLVISYTCKIASCSAYYFIKSYNYFTKLYWLI